MSAIITVSMDINTHEKSNVLPRFKLWARGHHVIVYGLAALGLLIAAGLVVVATTYQKPTASTALSASIAARKPSPPPAPVVYYSPLTGEKVATSAETTMPVTAIMLENSPAARPQSGLKDAGVVYEAIAEGGITRFLALYQQQKPQLIGPVRSVRMYYVDWLAPYNASVAHVGGSFYSLQEVRNGNYRDIDQFFYPGAYWRASDRYAPHNVYTSFSKLDALNAAKGYTGSTFTGFSRTDTKPAAAPATTVTINFGSPSYNTTYSYDAASGTYLRFMAGVPHLDREKGQIAPAIVIAMRVNMNRVLEDGYREQITTTGSGTATIFQNGTAQDVTWSKDSRQAQIKFTNQKGEDVPLGRGQTWIAAVPNGVGSVSWQ